MDRADIQDLVSIIVPVYNVEAYLEQCILSILNQNYRNIELILINDGSTDCSGLICEKYAKTDKRIKLVQQPNSGVTTARKKGVALATGAYIGFVDGDDYIDSDLYQKLMAVQDGFDLVISRWYREEGEKTRIAFDKIMLGAYRTQEDMDFLLDHLVNVSMPGGDVNVRSGFMTYMWGKLYKASIVKEVFLAVDTSISIGEDIDFLYRYFLKCSSVLLTDICGYHYRIRKTSASHFVDRNCTYLKNICKIYESLFPVFQAHPRCNTLLPQLQFKISTMLSKAPAKMGFYPEGRNTSYIFPFLNLLDNKRIVLFGAGNVGRHYRQLIERYRLCEIVLWVDNNWEEYKRVGDCVVSQNAMLHTDYDYVVLATSDSGKAEKQKEALVKLGIDTQKILWKKPLLLN